MSIVLLVLLLFNRARNQGVGATFDELKAFESNYGGVENYSNPLVPSGTYPNYWERYTHHNWNIVRMNCYKYVDNGYAWWSAIRRTVCDHSEISWPNQPVFYHPRLVEAARYHATDLLEVCKKLQHNSCNGVGFGARVNSFIAPGCGAGGEIAWGTIPDKYAMDGWLCELCCSGGCSVGGHTKITMSGGYTMAGAGHNGYIIGDWSSCKLYDRNKTPILSGLWMEEHDDATKYMFGASWYNKKYTRIRGFLVLNGERYQMINDLGTESMGHHAVRNLDGRNISKTSCDNQYYFEFTAKNGTKNLIFKYPKTGSLIIGETCSPGYINSQIAPSGGYPGLSELEENLTIFLTMFLGGALFGIILLAVIIFIVIMGFLAKIMIRKGGE